MARGKTPEVCAFWSCSHRTPKNKVDVLVHGFGMTRFAMMNRPEWRFATADSATWIHEARGLRGSGRPHGFRTGTVAHAAASTLDRDDRVELTLRSYDRAIAGESERDDRDPMIADAFGQARTVMTRLAASDREELVACAA